MDRPLHFDAFLRPMVWGGRRLAEVLGKRLPGDGPYGESWEISDHASHSSRIDRGPLAGLTLRDLMRQRRSELLGAAAARYETFPLLVKLLDANDWLSVQVHPDDEKVRTLWPGEGGKTEAWFVLAAAPASRIYAGLKPGVDEAALREGLRRGKVADCLHCFAPRPGDCLFLKAGTVHAVGGGVLMAEVQQTSDATFRLFDWNRVDAQGRARPLHVEQALACIDWQQGPVKPVRVPGFEEPPAGKTERRKLVDCSYFTLEYLRSGEPVCCGLRGRLQILTIVRGAGRLVSGGSEEELAPGQTWLLPASVGEACLKPRAGLGVLLSTLPA
ncbi:MAG TPA: type I phosphomannose isomerase catalytic subunit [Gemmataceae bacterium]|nr:type I phosphomannose isomerase catalytic subunit [Gemmataceae bacterium]